MDNTQHKNNRLEKLKLVIFGNDVNTIHRETFMRGRGIVMGKINDIHGSIVYLRRDEYGPITYNASDRYMRGDFVDRLGLSPNRFAKERKSIYGR